MLAALEAVDSEIGGVHGQDGAAVYLVGEPDNGAVHKIGFESGIAGDDGTDSGIGVGRQLNHLAPAFCEPIEQPDLGGRREEITRLGHDRAGDEDLALRTRAKIKSQFGAQFR